MKKQMKIPLFISRIGMVPKKAKTLLVARRFPSLALTRLSPISLLLGTLLPALISAQAPPALATQPVFLRPAVVPEERLLWRKTIRKTPLPSKGCFTVSYPSLTWKPVACVTPAEKGASRTPDTLRGRLTSEIRPILPRKPRKESFRTSKARSTL